MINIEPRIWGRSCWNTMYYVALSYPIVPEDDDKRHVKTFYENLQNVLPCKKCRINYKTHLEKYPLTYDVLQTREKLLSWLVSINNEVLYLTGKKQISLSDVHDRYIKNMGDKWDINLLIIITLSIIIVCLIIYNRYRT